jgi:hypothetical protein
MDMAQGENGRRRSRLSVAVTSLLVIIAGCGGGVENFTGSSEGTPGPGVPTATAQVPKTPTATPGLPAAIRFVGAQPATIGVRGSGLPVQSTLTFQVTDAAGVPVSGVAVSFTLSGIGDETIQPTQTASDNDGLARTTLTSGDRAATVRVTAGVDRDGNGSLDLFAQSTAVSVFGAPPSQSRFGIAAERLNVFGRGLFGIQDKISVFANDRFGNAVPPGTAISFTSNGASVVNPTTTDTNGEATATLVSENNIPPTGIVTVLAYTRGEESFRDNNGNGVFDDGDTVLTDDVPEPFIDFRPLPGLDGSCPIPAPSWLCNNLFDAGLPFELFVDTNANGIWDPQGTSGQWDDNIVVFDAIPVTFSGYLVPPLASPASFTILEGGSQVFTLEVHDDLLNPLVGGSTITVTSTSDKVKVTGGSITIPDGESFNQIIDGLNRFEFVVSDAAADENPVEAAASILVTVTSQNGNGSFVVASGSVDAVPPEPTPTPTVPGLPTPTPLPPASIQFVGAVPANIGVRQSGLPEQAVLTFKVTDANATPVANVPVTFSVSGIGDETIYPTQAVTDIDGLARTALTSGIRAATVRVIAGTDSDNNGSLDLFAQSTAVSVFGAPPSQSRFGIAAEHLNVFGRGLFGIQDKISVFANDRFGNAVPPGTAISFTSNGASVVNPTTTDTNGAATATLVTENNIPSTGIVTVLAYTRGEESFRDNNGNGIFDCASGTMPPCPPATGPNADTILTDNFPEPFIDFRPLPGLDGSCPVPAPSSLCNNLFDAGLPFELFVDGNHNGIWDPQGTSGQWDNNIFVFDVIPVTFSGHLVPPVAFPDGFTILEGGSQAFTLEVHDDLLNPLVGGSTITITSSSDKVKIINGSITIPDGESFNQLVDGLNRFGFVVADAAADANPVESAASIIVTVSSQNGSGSFVVANGSVDVPVPLPTPTPAPPPAQIQLALFVNQASNNNDGTLTSVISALVTDASGAAVVDGVPVEFSLVAPIPAGVSVTSPGLTGQAAPCVLGFTVPAQPGDALSCVKYDQARQGQTVTVQATVQTPSGPLTSTQQIVLPDLRTATPTNTATFTPTSTFTPTATPTITPTPTPAAAHIQVALFVNQASNNGDGTLSAVISALVTDATGAAVGNGIPVQFSLIGPTPIPAGVSVTSPGFTGQAAPCTLGFPVVAQPGDALSCVKYDQARQGQTVTVQATVQTPSGPLTSTQQITLPDLRTATPTTTFTFTPTFTATPTATPTITPTPTPAAAHIQVALFVNQASNNGDGTLSAVISALVTDATGAAVGNGIPVQFSLIGPTPIPAGVSVTSPGFTGQAAPCTLSFPVVAQPGDALSCVKYDQARQGQTVTIQATVQTPSGPLTSTQQITLPDLRTPTFTPSSTPTRTATPTATATPTPSATPTPAAAHIRLTLFSALVSPNLDGTMTGVISALVTDATGAAIGNGVPVQFSILPVTPTPSGTPAVPAGVSVTSPGFTGEAPPCVLCFTVPAQPGDALSCVKYDAALGGLTVTIQATVQTPSGPLADTQAITLPPAVLQCPLL